MRDLIQAYLTTVGEQIRWKRARPLLLRELEDHLLSESEAAQSKGMSPEEAQAEAVRLTGDPVIVGQELDLVHRPRPQWGLLALTLGLTAAGTILRVVLTEDWIYNGVVFFGNDRELCALALLLGSAALLAGYFLDHTVLVRWGRVLFPAALAVSFLLLPYWSPLYRASYYGVNLLFQCVPLLYAGWLWSWRGRGRLGWILCALGIPAALFVLLWAKYSFSPGLGSFLLLGAILTLLLASLTWGNWFALARREARILAVGSILVYGAAFLYLASRFSMPHSFAMLFHPEYFADSYGYTAATIRDMLAGVRWLGPADWAGPYPSEAAELVLPDGGNVYFLATVLRKCGLLPFLLLAGTILLLAGLLLVRGFRQSSALARLTAASVALPLLTYAVFSVLGNLGFVWLYVTLPLMGSNSILTAQMTLIGMVLSVFRRERFPGSNAAPRTPEKRDPAVSS